MQHIDRMCSVRSMRSMGECACRSEIRSMVCKTTRPWTLKVQFVPKWGLFARVVIIAPIAMSRRDEARYAPRRPRTSDFWNSATSPKLEISKASEFRRARACPMSLTQGHVWPRFASQVSCGTKRFTLVSARTGATPPNDNAAGTVRTHWNRRTRS